jgi:acetylornithine deacetylase/succinyl-diaminopimelate desuccinylase-like protein
VIQALIDGQPRDAFQEARAAHARAARGRAGRALARGERGGCARGVPPATTGRALDDRRCGRRGSTVVIGPDGAGAHALEEWVDLASCAALARILAEAACAYCGV